MSMLRVFSLMFVVAIPCYAGRCPAAAKMPHGLAVKNGWYVQGGHVIWGYGQHNGWWRPGQRPNLTRRAPGQVGPDRTEDLDKLTDAMLRFGYPGFEYNYGLWYDRRRDKHDTARRTDANVVPPFLEQPWARNGTGTAWDGLSKYDLTKYNGWYFKRLKRFADLCDRKGTILFHNCYMQHALLENQAHYADFPWRPVNCVQQTNMPDHIPAAKAFYDVSNPLRRKLHRAYIRKCLDVLGNNTNVVFLCSEEYTGPLSFMQFWLDTVLEWEKETGRDVHIGLGATKDVLDTILANPKYAAKISTIDLRYWWYQPNGKLFAPQGGRNVAGRYTYGVQKTSPEQFYRQIKEYRLKYPNKALLHTAPTQWPLLHRPLGSRQHARAALTAGVSMLIAQMPYPGLKDPQQYISPETCLAMQPTYDFIRRHVSRSLPLMKPGDLVRSDNKTTWCLADPGRTYLVYAMRGGRFQLDLSAAKGTLRSRWFNPRTGKLTDASGGSVRAGGLASFTAPDTHDWALWLSRDARHAAAKPAVIERRQTRRTSAVVFRTQPTTGRRPPKAKPARYPKWSPIELTFDGSDSTARGTPNPFAVRFDAVFFSPDGKSYRVPGFYDGDGQGGADGNVWTVRFSADREGRWTYKTASSDNRLDGRRGRFVVTAVAAAARGFWKQGRLEYTGTAENGIRYLKFREGRYWLKAGCDDPENFLGRYRNYNTPAKRKAAVDYLAARGVNSLYIMTHNIGGDDKDVWPWLGATAGEAKNNATTGHVRFDIAKLTEWRALFEQMQDRGVVPYLVLEDDSAWTGYDHDRYYREIIARFGDLPALLFNIGEENNENYPLAQGLALAKRFKKLDPYNHPLGIHNINRPVHAYVDSPSVDFTSIQTGEPGSRHGLKDAVEHNRIAIAWISQCRSRNQRVLMVNFDEGRPEHDRRAWWSAYVGGGVWEAHVVGPYDRPHSVWKKTWKELGGARAFMESLPFWKMQPRNDLIKAGTAFCLAKPGRAYALYLPSGGAIDVSLVPNVTYDVAWWDPANGKEARFEGRQTIRGGLQHLTAPRRGDWAVRITHHAGKVNSSRSQ